MNTTKLQSLSGLLFTSTDQEASFMTKLKNVVGFLKQLDQYDVSDTQPLISPLTTHTHSGSTHKATPAEYDILSTVEHQIQHRHIVVQSAVKKS